MAAMESLMKKTLVLSFFEGVDENGKDIIKRYSYSNIKENVTPENLLVTAVALTNLYKGTINETTTVDMNLLY